MSDLLDLRPDRPARRPRRRRRRRVSKLVALLIVLVIIGGLLVGGAYALSRVRSHFASAPDYAGDGSGKVVVQVKEGDTATGVASTLAGLEVVKSAEAFRSVAAKNPKSSSLQPGFYRLHAHMSASAALGLLLDPTARLRGRATIPEGSTQNQTLALLAKNTEVPLADYKAAAAHPTALGLPAYAQGHLEGFLFPATYDIEPGTSAVDVLKLLIQRFQASADSTGLVQRSQALGITPYQAVTVASLIERESRLKDEYPKVARVVYNRIAQKMTLGIDASILYGLGRTSGVLHESELAKDTPYNTRLHTGLPPTPIASPGDAALNAALQPAAGTWLYYVLADNSGRQLFTADYNEFLRQKAKSQAEGLF